MRDYAAKQPPEVSYVQQWSVSPPQYVVHLADGGALVLVDLVRAERYEIPSGESLDFAGSEAGRFLTSPVRNHADLTYYHQVLLIQPPEGQALAIGQYGALVSAQGS
jgi:hypothetical protein